MIEASRLRLLVLTSDTTTLCGVEAFARRLAATAGDRATTHVLDRGIAGLRQALEAADALVLNLPVVAWKAKLAEPVLAATVARAMRRDVVVILHEWADLDWKRRASYAPLLPLATTVLFSSPEVSRQFAASPLSRLTTGRRAIVPIPPNLVRPAATASTPASSHPTALALVGERARGRLILGHFGSIYPKKQSTLVLDVAARLKARGEEPFVGFIGSFVKGADRVEEDFFARVQALGLTDRVVVSGYVADDAELFALFDQVDVFLYVFAEGLTSRRASVLAAAASGRPVVVNAPRAAGAFDHHPTYLRLLDDGRLRLVPTDASIDVVAEAVVAARDARLSAGTVDEEAAWRDALDAVDGGLRRGKAN
ncbi:glycosyltransferase [Phreatobacter stygius]|uniref:Glycosyltransferase n=1 Tax=Phreatobacter stygius TaxID=1940610 RepID=A0A4D7B2D2_9HYPH|nr:glycosyltransferase [Phreatobacter stygius]QCI63696.1 glycosyltransferase [Phreatobacter stygius]